ncbi:MAG TPA: hypothetical protein VNN08_07530, partial [Thermoanaerobaculia bacterium]|nr:hypothetical protein [Thermoanaerobaculia bacterium]
TVFMNGALETLENTQLQREYDPLIRLSAPSPPLKSAGEKALDVKQCRRIHCEKYGLKSPTYVDRACPIITP